MCSPPPSSPPGLAGLVLCGGRSERMGFDKALLEFDGRPLVLRVAETIARVANPVLLATGEPGRLGALGYREVADERPAMGPLSGLVAGLEASPHELVAVVAVDLPFASPELFSLLAGLHDGEDAVVPVTDRGSQPLHAVYARRALPALREALEQDRRSLRVVLDRLSVRRVGEAEWRRADPTGRFAHNLNRPEDVHKEAWTHER